MGTNYYINYGVDLVNPAMQLMPLPESSLTMWQLRYGVNMGGGGRYESVDCSTGMEWWNGILE